MIERFFAYFGIMFGVFLGWLSPEELNPGRNYLLYLKKLLLVLLVAGILAQFSYYLIPFSLLSLFFDKYVSFWYVIFPLFAFFSDFSLYIIFLIGFPLGSLYVLEYFKEKKSAQLKELCFFAFKKTGWYFFTYFLLLILLLFL